MGLFDKVESNRDIPEDRLYIYVMDPSEYPSLWLRPNQSMGQLQERLEFKIFFRKLQKEAMELEDGEVLQFFYKRTWSEHHHTYMLPPVWCKELDHKEVAANFYSPKRGSSPIQQAITNDINHRLLDELRLTSAERKQFYTAIGGSELRKLFDMSDPAERRMFRKDIIDIEIVFDGSLLDCVSPALIFARLPNVKPLRDSNGIWY